MPLVVHPRVRKGLARLTAMTAVGLFASTGVAAACPTQPTTQAFAQLGDTSQYFAAPGGTFEGSSTSWTLQNATLSAGNEPFYINAPADSQSLTLGSNGLAYSQPFCIDSTMPSFRFFAHQVSGSGSLRVFLQLSGGYDSQGSTIDNVVTLAGGSAPSWTAISPVSIGSLLNLTSDGTMQARIAFQTPAATSWQVDDVFVDPYRVA